MRSLGFCVSVGHAQFMAKRFSDLHLPSVALSAASRPEERAAALRDLADGTICAVFTVDLFNEGIDIPAVDTLLLLRPTESPTLFLQQLGRGLRRESSKTVCTVLDFVGTHRKEFRFDRRFRALLGGSRVDVERQVQQDFPFLPAGCSLELDAVAKEIILRSIRESIPSTWRERCAELRSLGDVGLGEFLESSGLELEDIYAERSQLVGDAPRGGPLGRGCRPGGDLRSYGPSVGCCTSTTMNGSTLIRGSSRGDRPALEALPLREQRLLRMLVASLTTLAGSASFEDAITQLWDHPQVRAELIEVLGLLRERVPYLDHPLGLPAVPVALHSRYTRTEILAAFGVGDGAKPPTWQTGVWWEPEAKTDLFAFTLDKSVGGFSPTTRYRDYAVSPELIHWESQSATAADSPTGQRYINQREAGTNVLLFARLRTTDRAFWCLGPASYVSHDGDRPVGFVWKLRQRLPAELYTSFAAAVA